MSKSAHTTANGDDDQDASDDDQLTSASDLVEKYGRDRLEALADDGNIAAQAALKITDGDNGGE